jgi:hypothetical protein
MLAPHLPRHPHLAPLTHRRPRPLLRASRTTATLRPLRCLLPLSRRCRRLLALPRLLSPAA